MWAVLSVSLFSACSGTVPPPAPDDASAEAEWKEVELHLPDYPQDRNLLPMSLSKAVPARILIDSKSISVGRDGVVRYTVAIEGAGGARSIFYEGIRCDTREFKQFAFGTAELAFAPVAQPVWSKIFTHGIGAFRYEAYRYYFCAVGDKPLKPADIVRAIRYPQPITE